MKTSAISTALSVVADQRTPNTLTTPGQIPGMATNSTELRARTPQPKGAFRRRSAAPMPTAPSATTGIARVMR